MRTFLLVVVVVEGLALIAAGGLLLFGIEEQRAAPPAIPVFRPPIHDAVIGDHVRYAKLDPGSGEVLGYLDYRVDWAEIVRGTNFGKSFIIDMVERDAGGHERRRKIRVRPRDVNHGFLPPMFEEDLYAQVPGERPVIATIAPAPVQILKRKRKAAGFLIETVIPRRSLEKIAERYWMTDQVPLFGVARWEKDDAHYVLHAMESARR